MRIISSKCFDYLNGARETYLQSKKQVKSFLQYCENNSITVLSDTRYKAVVNCSSFLHFRNYYEIDTTKLHNANFCKTDKLCSSCASRRAYKQIQKVKSYFSENNHLLKKNWYFIVLPVKHNKKDSFDKVFDRVRKGLQSIRLSINNNKRGKKNNGSFFTQFDGIFYSIESTYSDNGWNVHINILASADEEIQIVPIKNKSNTDINLSQTWRSFSDSYIVNIQKVSMNDEEISMKSLLEIFKYSLKFQGLENDKLLEFYIKTYRKRLYGTIGVYYGFSLDVEIAPDDKLDEKYIDIFWKYLNGEYKEISQQEFIIGVSKWH